MGNRDAAPQGRPAAGIGPANAKRPNVIFILSDDQRAGTIHALGNDQIITPNLDKLAAQGLACDNAYIMGGNFQAVCMPSRAMIMTGRSLFHLDLSRGAKHTDNGKLGDKYLTLPETLRENGYATFATGKQHNGPAVVARGFTHAQSMLLGGMSHHMGAHVNDFDLTGEYPFSAARPTDKYSSEVFTDAAVQFLKSRPQNQPFFMYVSYTAPHEPLMAPPQYTAMYDPDKIKLPANFMSQHLFDTGPQGDFVRPFLAADDCTPASVLHKQQRPIDPANARRLTAIYYAMITHMDAQIGRLMATLAETGEADNTIVVFAGDNGLGLGQHGGLHKQTVYEHDVRVPLILRGPGIPKGARRESMCYLYDLFPTLCELIGVSAPATVEGKSLVPMMRDARAVHRPTQYFAYIDTWRGVRDDRYKLIEFAWKPKDGGSIQRKTLLFDLQTDPLETEDLSSRPKHAARLKRLGAEMIRWRDELGDTADKGSVFWQAYGEALGTVN
ncbi:MAG: sulfatase-like hydrolase/transferase [Phycisphaeraceae bacterium]